MQIELKKDSFRRCLAVPIVYYTLKTYHTAGTDYCIYHAIIKTIIMTPGGSLKRPAGFKHCLPCRVRTSCRPARSFYSFVFQVHARNRIRTNSTSRNMTKRKRKTETAFLDRITAIEEDIYWRVDILTVQPVLYCKAERASNLIKELKDAVCT